MKGSFPLNGTYFQVNEVSFLQKQNSPIGFIFSIESKYGSSRATQTRATKMRAIHTQVFADHETSHHPINVPRELLWNLQRRTVYFGTSTSAIFGGK